MGDNQQYDKSIEIWKMKKLIKSLEAPKGNGTSMIVNRLSVLGAITSAQQRLKRYNRVPPNGLVLYTGTIVNEEGKEKKVTIDFEPFRPINNTLYLCDNKFHTEANEYRRFGCALEFVTNKSQEGDKFCKGFGGVGGILRYQLDVADFDEEEDLDVLLYVNGLTDWLEKKFEQIKISNLRKLDLAKTLIDREAKTYVNQSRLRYRSWDSLKAALLFRFGDEDDPERLMLRERSRRFIDRCCQNKAHGEAAKLQSTEAIGSS
ncbi:hypothetical protein HID58_007379 [Brassica napus]|uniref:eRF1/Pelota-like N-terminal domain-containing protein n=3 Tax=Brassica TaxID=3705 RepID=A0ABQ8EES5_BRANA|nr:hypothetical protein HID58_007379 [Brassica napus]CDY45916.1 BnaAnng07970D [Brassica napus]VDC92191.1 unnamed protein product [Brassica rapa]